MKIIGNKALVGVRREWIEAFYNVKTGDTSSWDIFGELLDIEGENNGVWIEPKWIMERRAEVDDPKEIPDRKVTKSPLLVPWSFVLYVFMSDDGKFGHAKIGFNAK